MSGEQTTRAEPGANPADRDLNRDPYPAGNTEKDPSEWVSGSEPMTGAQASYLKTLSEQAREPEAYDPGLTKLCRKPGCWRPVPEDDDLSQRRAERA